MRVLAEQNSTTGSERVDVDPVANLKEAVDGMLEGLFEAIPGIGLGIVVLGLFWTVARVIRAPLERRLAQRRSKSFGRVFASLVSAAVVVAGMFFAIPLAVPSVDLLTMLGGLGLLGVAAGFAFQDILSNLLAGILLLIRDPFRAGDQITVNGITGTVQLITIRETQIVTFDGRLVYVPNADVYSNAIEVQTAQRSVRSSLLVGVEYDADLALARATATEVLRELEEVADVPEPQAYYVEFGASSITLDLRYWTSSREADIRRVQDRLVEEIKKAFDARGIGIPFDIITLGADDSLEQAMVAAVSAGRRVDDGAAREPLEDLTREQLYERAKRAGIEGRSRMTKRELVEALRRGA